MKKLIFVFFIFILLTKGYAYADYSRIVSLAPSLTNCLYDLGCQDKIVGVTSYCKAQGKQIVGSLLNLNLEKIIFLKPDLVLVDRQSTSPAIIEKLAGLHLNIAVFKPADNFKQICDNFIELAGLLGQEKKGIEIVKAAQGECAAIVADIKKLPSKKVFWQIGARPPVTINNDVFAADFIRFLGGENIFSKEKTPYPIISCEEVIRRNPDVIILVNMGDITEEQKGFWFKFKDMAAVKEKKIFIVDSDLVCQPTPLRFVKGLKEVARLL